MYDLMYLDEVLKVLGLITKNNYLLPGDKVHVIAPSGRGSSDNILNIKSYIESLGLVPVIKSDIYSSVDPFYSNTDEYRAKDLVDALTDDSKLVWCVKGGSGAMRLIPYLEKELPNELPQKLFVGYSDITVLHSYLQNKYGWSTIQGPMLEQIVSGFYDKDMIECELIKLISYDGTGNDSGKDLQNNCEVVVNIGPDGFSQTITFDCLKKIENNIDLDSNGLSSKIVGGNLTLVESSIGTNWQVDTKNKILFLEDVGEAAYKVERYLDHMKQAHMFDEAKGIIFGDFSGINQKNQKLVSFVEERFANSVDIPVFVIEGIGHSKVNHPLPLNTEAVITLSETGDYNLEVNNVFYNNQADYNWA